MRIRAPGPGDAERVTELVIAFDVEKYGEPDFELDDLVADWGSPGLDLDRDAWIVERPDGSLAAYAALHFNENVEVYVDGASRGLGIGSELLRRSEERAVARAEPGRRVLVGQALSSINQAGRKLLARAGYEEVRTYWRMTVPLDALPPPPQPPDGVVIRTFDPARDAQATYAVVAAAFEDNVRRHPFEPFEEWVAHEIDRKAFDPTLWLVAEQAGEIVGAVTCPDYATEAWVRQLAVAGSARGRGVGRTLLLYAFAEFRRRGRTEGALVVDSWNRTGAKALYESLGMRPEREHTRFEKELRPAT
ncbi:MAG TPA: GNAT family N-acetyltransferase [Gaiellaceae bacterium]|nr:GNAT family N-acetyltransferase [Gaiellaceae bacterium]